MEKGFSKKTVLSQVVRQKVSFLFLQKVLILLGVLHRTSALLALFLFLLCSCASIDPQQPPPKVPAFKNDALTTIFKKGVTTTEDVKNVLGEPNGKGEFLYPDDSVQRVIWFYEKIVLDFSGGKIDFQQDILMVYFKKETFDGFLWYSDASKDW